MLNKNNVLRIVAGLILLAGSVHAAAQAQLYFIHTDHLNTPRLITNNVGQPVWQWNNDDPFGNNAPNENPSSLGTFTCNLRLPGQYFDKETNTHYNYFRDYDPAIGRYVQSDTIGLAGGINTYGYVDSNPISNTDPLGLMGQGSGANAKTPPPSCICPKVPPAPPGASCNANITQAQQSYNPNWFYNQVRNQGPWDYKQQGSQYQNFGNFNYGATAAAFGLPQSVASRGAGWAQQQAGTSQPQWGNWYGWSSPYGDDPNDQAQIQQGAQYFRCGCYKKP